MAIRTKFTYPRRRELDGQVVKPALFMKSGHSRHFGGMGDGELVVDQNDKPIPFGSIGKLELFTD